VFVDRLVGLWACLMALLKAGLWAGWMDGLMADWMAGWMAGLWAGRMDGLTVDQSEQVSDSRKSRLVQGLNILR